MKILSQPLSKNNTIFYRVNHISGLSNHLRGIRGLILFCLVERKGLRRKSYLLYLLSVVAWNDYYSYMDNCLSPLRIQEGNILFILNNSRSNSKNPIH